MRNPETVRLLAEGKCRQLPDQPAVATLAATIDPACLRRADLIYVVVPAGATRDTLCLIREMANPKAGIIFAAKGLVTEELSDGMLLPEIAATDLPGRQTGVLSGPSFADEVLAGLPAALTIATQTPALIDAVQQSFANSNLRLYGNDDPIGVAVGGTMKNVIAIAAGCAVGLGLGDNAKAAILTRGVAEIARFAVAVGGRLESVYGLSGVGDLALTCAGPHSRNMAFGMALGRGEAPSGQLAEGSRPVAAPARLAGEQKHKRVRRRVVELLHQLLALRDGGAAVQTHRRVVTLPAQQLHQVQRLRVVADDHHPVLGLRAKDGEESSQHGKLSRVKLPTVHHASRAAASPS